MKVDGFGEIPEGAVEWTDAHVFIDSASLFRYTSSCAHPFLKTGKVCYRPPYDETLKASSPRAAELLYMSAQLQFEQGLIRISEEI